MLLRMRNWLYHQPYLMLALTPLFWAGNAVIGRGIHELVPPVTLAWWRWLLALLLLYPFCRKALRDDWPCIRKSWKKLTVLALLGVSCFNTLLYMALHTTYVMNAALLQSAMPAAIVLFSLLIFRERISGLQMLGLLLCIGGVVIIVSRGQWSTLIGFTFVEGDLWLLIAIASYALYSVLLRLKPEGLHPLSFLWITFLFGELGLTPLYVVDLLTKPLPLPDYRVAAGVVYIAVFPSILAFLFWIRGIELLGANRGGLFVNLVPVYASLLAFIFLGEKLMLFHILGLFLIVGGMLLFNRSGVIREKLSAHFTETENGGI